VDELAIGDFVVLKFPETVGTKKKSKSQKRFCVGEIIHIDFDNSQFSVHYWGTYATNLLKGVLKPEYLDPNDGKTLFLIREDTCSTIFCCS